MSSTEESPTSERSSLSSNPLNKNGVGHGGFASTTLGGDLVCVSESFARLHGWAAQELLGRNLSELREKGDTPPESGLFRATHKRKDGTTFLAFVDSDLVVHADGSSLRALHVRDISEELLEPTDRTLISSAVIDELMEGCQVIGFDFRYLYLNKMAAFHGRQAAEALEGRTMSECYPGIEQTHVYALVDRCLRERSPATLENEFEYPDGSRAIFELRILPVPRGALVLSVDVTEKRGRLSAIVEDSDDAIIGRDTNGLVTSWNRGAARIFEFTSAEMLGRPRTALVPPDLRDEAEGAIDRVLRGERISHFETKGVTKSGRSVDVEISLSPIKDAVGQLVGVSEIVRDVTEARKNLVELQRAKDSAEQLNLELESFSYSVAHDLRAPLRGLDGFSQALIEDYDEKLDETGKKYLANIRSSAQLMARLIDDMLLLARVSRQDLVVQPLDLTRLAEDVFANLRRTPPERVVDFAILPNLKARGDLNLVRILLENLLGNAWKFTSKLPAAHISVGVTPNGEFFVRDDGAGFDPRFAHKLFGTFQRLHSTREFEGTGIGLATVARVVRRHGGRVRAEGAPSRGATFYFTLEEPQE